MIKRTLYFGNPAYLSVKHRQLVVKLGEGEEPRTIPCEDVGMVILDHPQITLSYEVMRLMMEYGAVLISCDKSHLPDGYMLPISGHHLSTKHLAAQVDSSVPLVKQLWQQTVEAKIRNQAAVLDRYGYPAQRLLVCAKNVSSGDSTNQEGQAAAYYWPTLFGEGFTRAQEGDPPNGLLNYGYAILRGLVARALVSSGLHPSIGIHHHNQYNAYCLADDIMEPYRPYVDILAYEIWMEDNLASFLTKDMKAKLLGIATVDIRIGRGTSPLMVGLSQTTASFCQCLMGKKRKIEYPSMD